MKKITCPINPKTKAQFECEDCKFLDACIEDRLDYMIQKFMKEAAKAGRDIGKLLKERRGL